MAATTALREALNKGISSGNLIDAKIILYSHRDSSACVCRPKALYTSSHVLKTVPYFNDRESTATLDTTRVEPHTTVSKCSSEISRNHSQRTSKRQLMKKNSQRITVIRPTATLRRMKDSHHPRTRPDRRLTHQIRPQFPERIGLLTRNVGNTLTKGRW